MAVTYTTSTQHFYKELSIQQRVTHNKEDMQLSTRKRKTAQKLYEGNTDKFEPIEKNREHLIKTMMPMVTKMAKFYAQKYDRKIEFDDCISAGLLGATEATDIYIRRSKVEKQAAKLSTYAHFWIEKYIKEYCRNNMTILSSGPTKVREALTFNVLEGNRPVNDEGRSVEFFDICNDANITSNDNTEQLQEAESASIELLKGLSTIQKNVLILSFGICSTTGEGLNHRKIARKLNLRTSNVQSILTETLEQLRAKFEDANSVLMALKGISFNDLAMWKIEAA